jgi:ketosteroid isomerase-like protein
MGTHGRTRDSAEQAREERNRHDGCQERWMMREDPEDSARVREVADRYVDAAYRGDVQALRACFHPLAIMCGYLGDALLAGSPEPFFQDIASMPSMQSTGAPYVAKTTSVEVVGNAASVRIDETGFAGDMAFANWFHLLKDADGGWKIVSKLFTSLDDDLGSDA